MCMGNADRRMCTCGILKTVENGGTSGYDCDWRIPDNRNRGNNLTILSVSGSGKIRRKCICRIIIKRGAGSGNDRGGDLFRNCIPGNRYSGICTGIIYTFHFEYQFEINTGNKYR